MSQAMQPVETIAPGRITEARLIEVVFPQQTNHYGTLFGGQVRGRSAREVFRPASA